METLQSSSVAIDSNFHPASRSATARAASICRSGRGFLMNLPSFDLGRDFCGDLDELERDGVLEPAAQSFCSDGVIHGVLLDFDMLIISQHS
jgi:hypothetical protein